MRLGGVGSMVEEPARAPAPQGAEFIPNAMAGDYPFPTPVAVGSQDPSARYEYFDGRCCRLRGARSFLIAKVRTCGLGRISIDA